MTENLMFTLTRDEAVVLFEWLARFNAKQDYQFEDQAEQRVLWNLESTLVEPFKPDYDEVLASARSRVRDSTE